MSIRFLVASMLALLPPRWHRWLGCRLLGWDADPTAYVGHSIVAARTVVLGPYAAIGHLNMIKGIEELRLGQSAGIGFLNWISGPSLASGHYPESRQRRPALIMGTFATMLHRHIVDCSDTVEFGAYSTLGGWRSTVMTHGLDIYTNVRPVAPVLIGERSLVLSNCVILGSVPAHSVIAAGTVVRGLKDGYTLYRGNPAVAVRSLPEDLAYFVRTGSAE